MTRDASNWVTGALESTFGSGRIWSPTPALTATAWEPRGFHLMVADGATESHLRKIWSARKGRWAHAVILLAPSTEDGKVVVIGPQHPQPVREMPAGWTLELLKTTRGFEPRSAASFIAGELKRLAASIFPGLRLQGLLMSHFVSEHLQQPQHLQRLSKTTEGLRSNDILGWRPLFTKFGYQIQQLPLQGYLLRYQNKPVAVIHPHRNAEIFNRLTRNLETPADAALFDCVQRGALWAMLAAGQRIRLIQSQTPTTGGYAEFDAGELAPKDMFCLGLLSPESLREGGWLTQWVAESQNCTDPD